jgi:hypothetical protein
MFAPESVELLQKSGIDFQRHEEIGILPNDFSELMITSGLVLTDETRWISFHRCVIRLSSTKSSELSIAGQRLRLWLLPQTPYGLVPPHD